MTVFVGGRRIKVQPAASIGKGGEADVYLIDPATVLKIYKPPEHPDYANQPAEQEAARQRLEEHQRKLPAFPAQVPPRVIAPRELAYDQRAGGRIVGYTMPFLKDTEVLRRYGERSFRQTGVAANDVIAIFLDLHASVVDTHLAGIVIGDFNDLNVLVDDLAAYLIDADSFQFGGFLTRLYTMRFVDPVLCDPSVMRPVLAHPHNDASDWYAFNVLLFQSLLYVDPYGGVFRPRDQAERLPHDARPLKRITVFHPEVRYPKPALPYDRLPDELLQHFHEVFHRDQRGYFPRTLLENLRWTTCTACGAEHARGACPVCRAAAPPAVKEKTVVRGSVTATRLFKTDGVILHASLHRGRLHWFYHENHEYRREDGFVVAKGAPDPRTRYRLLGPKTLLGRGDQVITFAAGAEPERLAVDRYGLLPLFDTSETARFWIHDGRLMKDGELGPEYIGDVLAGQTLFWTGNAFGFGFYRAGELAVNFVFATDRRGMNDTVRLPRIAGQLIDSVCFFTDRLVWFLLSLRESGRTVNRCHVIDAAGRVVASAEALDGDGSWLGSIRGKCAAGDFLLAATDGGVVRVEPSGSALQVIKEFPDTEPFVDPGCHLFPGKEGLYVVDAKEVRILKIG